MKKAILLLTIICIGSSLFAQRSNHFLPSSNSSSNPALATAFQNFESTVFTESDQHEIINSYLTLGKNHQATGNLAEAVAFYERAFVLANEYFRSLPGKSNPLLQLKNSCQSMLELCYPEGRFSAFEKGAMSTAQYLKQYGALNGTAFQSQSGLSEEKVVASFFLDATEPAKPTAQKQFAVTKSTSLRQGATHRSRSIKRLGTRDRISVLEKTNKHWWMVDVNGQTGYVKALLLKQQS